MSLTRLPVRGWNLCPHTIVHKAGVCPNVPLLLYIGVLFHYPNVRNFIDDVIVGFRKANVGQIPNVGFFHNHYLGPSSSPRSARADPTPIPTFCARSLGLFVAPAHWNVRTVRSAVAHVRRCLSASSFLGLISSGSSRGVRHRHRGFIRDSQGPPW